MLRRYQVDCIEAIEDAWEFGIRRPAVVLPTGTGKTVILAALCKDLVRRGYKPLLLVNRDELCVQAAAKFAEADEFMSVGIVKAEKHQIDCNVTVASVQTLSRDSRMKRIGDCPWDVVIADECHFSASDSWQKVMTWAGCFEETGTLSVGFTATLMRTDKRALGETWDDVCYYKDTQWAISAGFLVPVRAQRVKLPDLDLARVRQQNGDYADGDLGAAMAQADACPIIAQAYSKHARNEAGDLRRGIIFAPTVELAHCLTDEFRAAGIPTETVIGTTPIPERKAIYAATASGENRVISSVGVLVYGFDLPPVEVAVMARPTRSALVYIQAAGRVLRPSPGTGKTGALILDVVGASRIGLATPVDLGVAQIAETDEEGRTEVLEGRVRLPGLKPDVPDEIEFVEVDPFAGLRRKITPRGRTPWLLTKRDEIPFLPGTQTKDTVFLWPQEGGWTVWRLPRAGCGVQLTEPRPFPLAVEAALATWGPKPAKMQGDATDNQRLLLSRLGVCYDENLERQAAGDLISIELVSRRLEK